MERRPHLLWIVPFLPSPPYNGGRMRMHVLLNGLAADYRITLLSFIHDRRQAFEARDLEARGIAVRCVLRRASPVPPSRNLPGMIHPFYSDEMFAELSRVLQEDPPAAVQVEFLQMAPYGLAVPADVPLIYTEHDAGHLTKGRSYLPTVPNGEPPIELSRRRLLTRRILRRAQRAVAMSDWDAGRLRALVASAAVDVVPMGVHCDRFAQESPSARRVPGRVLFVGYYPHYPNSDAARILARRIMPSVFSRSDQAHLVLAGADPTPEIRSLAGPRVAVTGTLPDLRPELFSASVFAAPIRLGYGMKTKLLEAFAAGLPVVALKPSLRGIPARDGRDVMVARDISDFPRRLLRLLEDPSLRRRLAESSTRLARRFDWSLAVEAHRELYRRMLADIRLDDRESELIGFLGEE